MGVYLLIKSHNSSTGSILSQGQLLKLDEVITFTQTGIHRFSSFGQKATSDHVPYSWYMAGFFNSGHHCWRLLPAQKKEKILTVTVEESCQPLLHNCVSDCWTIVPVTVEESWQPLLNNCASDYWTTVPATVQQVNALTIMSVRKYLSEWARIIQNPVSWLPLGIN